MDDLSEALKSASDGPPQALDLPALHRRARTRRLRRRITAGAAALSLVALTGIGVAAATRDGGSPAQLTTAAADAPDAPASAGTIGPCAATTTSTTTPQASKTTDAGLVDRSEPTVLAPGALTEEQLQAVIDDEHGLPTATTTPSTDDSTTPTSAETTDPVETTTTTTVCAPDTTPTTAPGSVPEDISTTTDPVSTTTTTSTAPTTPTTAPGIVPEDTSTTTDPISTTTTTSTAPTTPTTTPPEAADPLTLAGSFIGESPILEPDPQGCPQLRHRFEAEVIFDGEPSWGLQENYCGVNDGETWRGSGTFEFTGPAGDSFAGTFSSRVNLPTTGEPYRMTVTDGTGRFAGLTGTCDLDNHLENTTPGRQRQYGTLTCDLRATP